MKRQKCPCCGYYTFKDGLGKTYDICPVCFWEDDLDDYSDPDIESGGNNEETLREARENFLRFGACEPEMKEHVRQPLKEEMEP